MESEFVKIKYVNNPKLLEFKLKEIIKIQVLDKNFHEIKNEKFLDYTDEFEMIGKLSIGDQFMKLIIELETLLIVSISLTLLIRIINQKVLFSTVMLI